MHPKITVVRFSDVVYVFISITSPTTLRLKKIGQEGRFKKQVFLLSKIKNQLPQRVPRTKSYKDVFFFLTCVQLDNTRGFVQKPPARKDRTPGQSTRKGAETALKPSQNTI